MVSSSLNSASYLVHRNEQISKAPSFSGWEKELDSYLQHFERFARSNGWNEKEWTTALSALLTGKALDVYSRMSDEAAVDYTQLKRALLKLYDLTEDEYKNMFRRSRPEVHENP